MYQINAANFFKIKIMSALDGLKRKFAKKILSKDQR